MVNLVSAHCEALGKQGHPDATLCIYMWARVHISWPCNMKHPLGDYVVTCTSLVWLLLEPPV